MKKNLEKLKSIQLSKNDLKRITGGLMGECTCPGSGVTHVVSGRDWDELQMTGNVVCGEPSNCCYN